LHHIVEVSEGGGNAPDNLIALCPTCHALFHRGEIRRESIQIWKGMLITLNKAFDQDAIDTLLFLSMYHASIDTPSDDKILGLTADAVFSQRKLIIAGLIEYRSPDPIREPPYEHYLLYLSEKGKSVVQSWKNGDKKALAKALTKTS